MQLNGECNGVYVEKWTDGFDVIELDKGTNNVPFDYRVVAKRKGYENYRFEKMGGLTPEEMEAKQAVYSEKTEKELKDLLQYQGKEIDEVK
uniref:Uncharacterized protein n=1 Tax=Candidatus Methanophaga sp. ANME-1 ERB7 TaxID=2759913 RepID=A0A7G9ZCC9_9EURY|nr:hypothetical protein GHLLLOKB_00001 [Methanosarcinales archaeon ANME-1 ERB7]